MKPTQSDRDTLSRRDALRLLGAIGATAALAPVVSSAAPAAAFAGTPQPFSLPPLGFAHNALEPHIDARTMEIHHSKHHQAYIDNANKALADQAALRGMTAEAMLADLSRIPESIRTPVRNNVGGHVNHAFFWKLLKPGGKSGPSGRLEDGIKSAFGSFDAFKTQFADSATKRFGSGWGWLVSKDGRLQVMSTANQDSPLSDKAVPIIGLDVWEHAYYLKYQNRRADYITAFWQVLNWDVAEGFFQSV